MRNIYLTQEAFDLLPEYSATFPSATTIGKQWKRRQPGESPGALDELFLGEYVPCDEAGLVGIKWQKIVISPAGLKADQMCHPKDWVKMFEAAQEGGA